MEKPVAVKESVSETRVRRLVSGNMRRHRALQSLSQIELARASGLTHNFISDIENCKKGVSDKTIAKISFALEIEPHQLFLPENLVNDVVRIYVGEFNSSVQKVVADLSGRFLSEP